MSRPAIVCVDDERTVLVSLKEQLRRRFGKEYLVETADSGVSALEVLEELLEQGTEVPVIISDHIMPGIKGDELLERVEARSPETIKIMLTGQASADAVGHAVNRANLFRYLAKPWDEGDLAQTVRTALDTFESRRRLEEHQATLHELNELALELTASLGTHDRYERLVARLHRALGVSHVALFGLRQGALRRLATFGGQPDDVPRVLRPDADSKLAMALSHGGVARCSLGGTGCGIAEEVGWPALEGGALGIALQRDDEIAGLLVLASTSSGVLDALGDDRLLGFAALAAASIRTAGLIEALEAASERQRQLADALLREADARSSGPMQGDSSAITATLDALRRAAATDKPLLIVGAPGTGHEAAARFAHRSCARAAGPFLRVSGAAVQNAMALAIGDASSTSRVRLAEGGTLYISGVDRLSCAAQAELAWTLERIAKGGPDMPKVNVIVSTSVLDAAGLRAALEEPLLAFLEERVTLPLLRERLDDIPALAGFYLRAYARRLGRDVDTLPQDAEERLRAYPWPGNVEELEHVIERAVLTAPDRIAALETALVDASQALGSYRLLERIGAGGMGEVWKARHEHLSRPAAVKLIKSTVVQSRVEVDRAAERFRREAGATSRLRSPHTVELYDFGVSDNGDLYYVMELLDGIDLQTLVAEHGALPAERVVMLLLQACHSLMEAHEAGLVHRDIKPGNLLVCSYGPDHDFLKVLDFGIVSLGPHTGDTDVTSLTEPGTIAGTPSTMPPESLRGASEARSDLYALGCTAYFMLTGRHVFISNVPAVYLDHMNTPPIPPTAVTDNPIPAALEHLVLDLLQKDPAARPPSARVLRDRLRAIELPEPWTEERAAAWWAAHHD